jgi:hypothetical protein
VGKPDGKRQLGRARHRWENNIIMYRKEIEREGMDWINRPQDRSKWWAVVSMVMDLGFSKMWGIY